MNEKRTVHVNCPSCATPLQVKTRSAEKTVVCPKCQASVMVSVTAAEELPFAAQWDEPQPAFVAPQSAVASTAPAPIDHNAAFSHRCSPRQLAGAGGIFASLFLTGIVFAFALPGGGPRTANLNPAALTNHPQNNSQPGGAPVDTTNQPAAVAGQLPEGEETVIAGNTPSQTNTDNSTATEPANNQPGGNFQDALSKFQQGGNAFNQGGNFNQGGGGFPSTTPRDQQRNWDLANGGRMGAMGLKKVQVPRR